MKIRERSARIGLASKRWERLVLPLNYDREMERTARLELACGSRLPLWKRGAQPLGHVRIFIQSSEIVSIFLNNIVEIRFDFVTTYDRKFVWICLI